MIFVCKTKVLQFTGFNLNAMKTFKGLAISLLKVPKKANGQKIHQENFCVSTKTAKVFSRLTLVIYSILLGKLRHYTSIVH